MYEKTGLTTGLGEHHTATEMKRIRVSRAYMPESYLCNAQTRELITENVGSALATVLRARTNREQEETPFGAAIAERNLVRRASRETIQWVVQQSVECCRSLPR